MHDKFKIGEKYFVYSLVKKRMIEVELLEIFGIKNSSSILYYIKILSDSSLLYSHNLYTKSDKVREDWVDRAEIATKSKSPELDRYVLYRVYDAIVNGNLDNPGNSHENIQN